MVVADFHLVCIRADPSEANPPLVIDADGMLSLEVSLECLESISRGHPQIGKLSGSVQLDKFAECDASECGKPSTRSGFMQASRLFVFEGNNHDWGVGAFWNRSRGTVRAEPGGAGRYRGARALAAACWKTRRTSLASLLGKLERWTIST